MYKKTFIAVLLIGIFLSYFLLSGKIFCPVTKASALGEAQVQPFGPRFHPPQYERGFGFPCRLQRQGSRAQFLGQLVSSLPSRDAIHGPALQEDERERFRVAGR